MVEYATIGKLYNVDSTWAKKANPHVYESLQAREDFDFKLLKKKKEQKILQDRLWKETQGISFQPAKQEE